MGSSKDLEEKIRLSREAFEVAQRVSAQLEARFKIDDLQVAATAQKVLVVSGTVDEETERRAVVAFLEETMAAWELKVDLRMPQ